MTTAPRSARPSLSLAAGQLLGWALLIPISVAVLTFNREPSVAGKVQAQIYFYAAGQLLAMGLLTSAVVDLWQRLPARRPNYSALWLLTGLVAWWMLPEDLQGAVGKLPSAVPPSAWLALLLMVAATSIPAAAKVGRLCARSWLRWLAVLLALGVAVANHQLAVHDYAGVHFFAALAAATLIGSALARHPAPPHARASLLAHSGRLLLAVPAAIALVVPPSNRVGVQLYRGAQAVVAPWTSRLQRKLHTQKAVAFSPRNSRWYVSRNALPPQPPSGIKLLPDNPVVLLFIVDTMRADLLDGSYAKQLPNFTRLADDGVQFLNARSAAPATTQSISTLTTSRYYSQLFWETREGTPLCQPYDDDSIRFPEVLANNGIKTVSRVGLPSLVNRYGVLRGMQDELVVKRVGRHYATSERVMPAVFDRLREVGGGPLFMYVHVDDPHMPYTIGQAKGKTPFDHYLAEVAYVDMQLGLLRKVLDETGLAKRTLLIVTADHGEAFGEHGQKYHATTVYEELLHIPLLVHYTGIKPRKIKQPVSLVDMAPTILDAFRLPAPGAYMGQSLVPLIAGRDVQLSRPIVADSPRLMRAMVFQDGMKLIFNIRTNVYELYDLNSDPEELNNIYDEHPEAPVYTGLMTEFFEVHEIQRPGYETTFCR